MIFFFEQNFEFGQFFYTFKFWMEIGFCPYSGNDICSDKGTYLPFNYIKIKKVIDSLITDCHLRFLQHWWRRRCSNWWPRCFGFRFVIYDQQISSYLITLIFRNQARHLRQLRLQPLILINHRLLPAQLYKQPLSHQVINSFFTYPHLI